MKLSLAEVDQLSDALGEVLGADLLDHWNKDALDRLRSVEKRLRDYWNAQPREQREAVR